MLTAAMQRIEISDRIEMKSLTADKCSLLPWAQACSSAPLRPSVRCFKPSCSRHTQAAGQCALAARLHLAVRPVPTRPAGHRSEPSCAAPSLGGRR